MSTTKEITIFIAEDHLISRMGLRMLLEQTSHFKVVGEAEDGQAAVDNILKLKPEVIMMDLGLPKMDGAAATEIIKRELPQTKVLIFTTADDDDSIFSALRAGADGYCLKTISGDLLSTAIHSVLNGAAWLDPGIANKVLRAQATSQPKIGNLTNSKLQLLSLVEQGKNVDEIASELRVNDSLVKGLLHELLSQLKGETEGDNAATRATKRIEKDASVNIGPGDIIGEHYKIESRIGHGGMGCVFKASHTIIGRPVAVKTLHEHLASDEQILGRFKKEAEASACLSHPNLVTIYDFGLYQGKVPYIVMELLDGFDLYDLLEEVGKLEPKAAQHIFVQVCDALAVAHDKGIVHRDLKPSNIMLVSEDLNVKLVDFGIAKILEEKGKALTLTGEAIGSPPYMSPEQCSGDAIDQRSDLYSLGCVMHEAYTGVRAFDGGTAMEVMMQHLSVAPSQKALKDARVPSNVVKLILSMLDKEPSKRPKSATEVRQALLSK